MMASATNPGAVATARLRAQNPGTWNRPSAWPGHVGSTVAGAVCDPACPNLTTTGFRGAEWPAAAMPLGDGRLAEAAHGPFRLAAAEVVARSTGSARLTFDPPLPLAVIARSLRDLERRGVRCTPGVDSAAVLTGTDPVPSLELALGEPVRAGTSRSDGASEAAYHDGLPVDRTLWQRLSDAAADFLVSEAILDAALEPTS